MSSKDESRRFLDPRTIARISRLDLRARQVVEGYISGLHKSPFFGQSVEFVQHREYVPGDDIRHMDWKVWSRSDRFYIKQFEAETNLRANFVVDTSESMSYGNGPLNKYNYACTAAACLAYMALRQQDSAGITCYNGDITQALPPKSTPMQLDAIVKALDVSKPAAQTDIKRVLRRVAEASTSRSLVVLFSDLLTDREPLFQGLEMLRHRRHDVMVFHIMDDEELDFNFAGMTRFEGMEEMPHLMCDPKALRQGYLEEIELYLTEVRRGCTRLGVDYSLIRTSDYLDAVLSKFLFSRMARKASGRR